MSVERPEADNGDNANWLVASVVDRSRLPVRFRIGRLELMTSELSKLSVGQVLSLDKPVSSEVEVVVEGVSVGEGELVAIDGGRGVRLLRVDVAER